LNIEVHSKHAWPNQLANIATPMIHNYALNPEDWVMIFIENQKDVAHVANQLDCFFHHSGLTDKERDSNVASWLAKECGVIVVTSGFGAGINYAHGQLVIIYGIPSKSEANKVYQKIGRAGRDGKEARI
jgi:superfamily II DNA helicase RecQ